MTRGLTRRAVAVADGSLKPPAARRSTDRDLRRAWRVLRRGRFSFWVHQLAAEITAEAIPLLLRAKWLTRRGGGSRTGLQRAARIRAPCRAASRNCRRGIPPWSWTEISAAAGQGVWGYRGGALSLDPPHHFGDCFLVAGPGMPILRLAAVMGYPPFTVSAACPGFLRGMLAGGPPGAVVAVRSAVTGSGLVRPLLLAGRRRLRACSSIRARGASLRAGAG